MYLEKLVKKGKRGKGRVLGRKTPKASVSDKTPDEKDTLILLILKPLLG